VILKHNIKRTFLDDFVRSFNTPPRISRLLYLHDSLCSPLLPFLGFCIKQTWFLYLKRCRRTAFCSILFVLQIPHHSGHLPRTQNKKFPSTRIFLQINFQFFSRVRNATRIRYFASPLPSSLLLHPSFVEHAEQNRLFDTRLGSSDGYQHGQGNCHRNVVRLLITFLANIVLQGSLNIILLFASTAWN